MPAAIRDGRQAVPADKPKPAPIVMTEQPAPTMTVFMVWVAKYKSGRDRSLKQTAAMWPPRVTVKRGCNSRGCAGA